MKSGSLVRDGQRDHSYRVHDLLGHDCPHKDWDLGTVECSYEPGGIYACPGAHRSQRRLCDEGL